MADRIPEYVQSMFTEWKERGYDDLIAVLLTVAELVSRNTTAVYETEYEGEQD